MSLHRSLKTKPAALNQHRNVLKRAERIERLRERDVFDPDSDSPLGLVKVANRQVVTKKKKKAATEETPAQETEGTSEAPPAERAASRSPPSGGLALVVPLVELAGGLFHLVSSGLCVHGIGHLRELALKQPLHDPHAHEFWQPVECPTKAN